MSSGLDHFLLPRIQDACSKDTSSLHGLRTATTTGRLLLAAPCHSSIGRRRRRHLPRQTSPRH